MKGVQFYELLGGIALKNHTFLFNDAGDSNNGNTLTVGKTRT